MKTALFACLLVLLIACAARAPVDTGAQLRARLLPGRLCTRIQTCEASHPSADLGAARHENCTDQVEDALDDVDDDEEDEERMELAFRLDRCLGYVTCPDFLACLDQPR